MGWKVWEPYPAVICVVLGIWQMLDLLRPNFVSTREEYDELKQIRYLSNEALSHLERLWVRLYENGEEAGEIQKVFFEQCVPEMNHIKSISDSLIVPCNIKSIQKAAEAKILNYKKRYE
ncbi:MAG: hypothetical protein K2H70_01640 [Bacteroidales bacterium]|nr:hypothetical protein [Bacteroidales bacterium]